MISSLREFLLYGSVSPVIAVLAKATAALVLGLTATRVARRSRASVRHSILAVSFGTLLLLPLTSSRIPSVKIPVAVDASHLQATDSVAMLPSSPLYIPGIESPDPAQPERTISWTPILLVVWLAGAGCFLFPVFVGLWQSHTIRRNGIPWRRGKLLADCLAPDVAKRVRVYFHENLSGPITCGVFQPAVFFPPDSERWSDDDLSRAMIHELEHVRRADRLWHVFARILCAIYWFHPLVWIAWHRLALEAENACDDAVLARWESDGYADQLLALGRKSASSLRQSHALGMASRTDLATRIHATLDPGRHRGRAGARAVFLFCCAGLLAVAAMSAFRLVAAPQAQPPQPILRFDVVSVKPVEGATGGAWDPFPENGSWTGKSMAIPVIIAYAYGISASRVEGVPKDLQGPDPGFTIVAKMPISTSRNDFFRMMQSLLADRFKARIHTETRDIPVNTIELAKGGVKLRPASGQCVSPEGNSAVAAGQHRCHDIAVRPSVSKDQNVTWEYSGWSVSMTDIVARLGWLLAKNGLMVDDTGLSGLYDLEVKFETHHGQDEFDSQAIWQHDVRDAWEKQAGLMIDLSKTSMRPGTVVVVDHVEYPTPN